MSISKKLLICLVAVMFVFGVSCAGNDSSKIAEKTDTSSEKTVKAEKVVQTEGVEKLVAQTQCPIMESPINKDLYVDKDGKRIYMCCAMCKEQIETNFEDIVKAMEKKGVKPETL